LYSNLQTQFSVAQIEVSTKTFSTYIFFMVSLRPNASQCLLFLRFIDHTSRTQHSR